MQQAYVTVTADMVAAYLCHETKQCPIEQGLLAQGTATFVYPDAIFAGEYPRQWFKISEEAVALVAINPGHQGNGFQTRPDADELSDILAEYPLPITLGVFDPAVTS